MANDDLTRGFVPLRWPNVPVNYYRVSSSADIYLGQPVALDSTGYVVGAATGGAGGVAVLGVAVGFAGPNKSSIACNDPFLDVSDITPPSGGLETGDRYVAVVDDPHAEFYIQEDTGGTALALADVGAGTDLVWRGAGSAVTGNGDTGWATLELDASTVGTGTGVVCQILRLHDSVNSDGTNNSVGDYAKWVVRFTRPQKGQTTVTPLV